MLDLQELQILAQLVDNMDVLIEKLEKSYSLNNAEDFNKAKSEMLDTQNKIGSLIK